MINGRLLDENKFDSTNNMWWTEIYIYNAVFSSFYFREWCINQHECLAYDGVRSLNHLAREAQTSLAKREPN